MLACDKVVFLAQASCSKQKTRPPETAAHQGESTVPNYLWHMPPDRGIFSDSNSVDVISGGCTVFLFHVIVWHLKLGFHE